MTKTEMIGFSMKYEAFICDAFKCERNKHDASADFFRIFAETEPSYKGTMPASFEKQYNRISKSLSKAIDKYLKNYEFSENDKESLNNMKLNINNTKSAERLGELITGGLKITKKYS